MPSKNRRTTAIEDILKLTHRPLAAETGEEFFEAVRQSYDALHRGLLGPSSKRVLRALEDAQDKCHLRQRRVLDVCSWPVFDKPAVPAGEDTSVPEFLWIFCLPFVVQFAMEATAKPIFLPNELFDGRAVLRQALGANWLNPKALLAGFPTLMSREDLHLLGPWNLASSFIQAELGGCANLQPLPRELDPEVESGRLSTYFMVAAARLPAGEKQLFVRTQGWPAEAAQDIVRSGLREHGIPVEAVVSLPPCSVTESLFRCTNAGAAELNRTLDLAVAHYAIKEVELLLPADGMAELSGYDAQGQSYVLCSPFSFVEPQTELRSWLSSVCKERGLGFTSAALAIPTSSMMH